MDFKRILVVLAVIFVLIILTKMYKDYQENSLAKAKLQLQAQQMELDALSSQQSGGTPKGWLGNILDDLPLIGGWY